jgi:hypothetical protein
MTRDIELLKRACTYVQQSGATPYVRGNTDPRTETESPEATGHEDIVQVRVEMSPTRPASTFASVRAMAEQPHELMLVTDSAHVTETIRNRLCTPVKGTTGDQVTLYTGIGHLRTDGDVIGYGGADGQPRWRVRGDPDQTRVCELLLNERVIATYDLTTGTGTVDIDALEAEADIVEVVSATSFTASSTPPSVEYWLQQPALYPSLATLDTVSIMTMDELDSGQLSTAPTAQHQPTSTARFVDQVVRNRTIASPGESISVDALSSGIKRAYNLLAGPDSAMAPVVDIEDVLADIDALTLEEAATTVVADRAWALPADGADAVTPEGFNVD